MSKSSQAKRAAFVAEYLVDLNATQAAIRAGYSERTAKQQGARLLTKGDVQAELQAAMKARAERTEVTQDRVLKELARLAFFDMRKLYGEDGSLKRPQDWDDDTAAVLAGIEVVELAGEQGALPQFVKKAKVWDKAAALSLCMRHLGMLVDKRELSGPGGGPIPTEDKTPKRPRLTPQEWLLAHGIDLQEIGDVGPATGKPDIRVPG